MARPIVRELLLPTALSVTTFAVVLAGGGDDDETQKNTSAVVAGSELASGDCEPCKDDQGKTTCGPTKDCYKTSSGGCKTGGSS